MSGGPGSGGDAFEAPLPRTYYQQFSMPVWDLKADEDWMFARGMGLFDVDRGDSRHLEIQGLDDPDGVAADRKLTIVRRYDGPEDRRDAAAAKYLQSQADAGADVARRAIESLIACHSPDVEYFNLRRTWGRTCQAGDKPKSAPPVQPPAWQHHVQVELVHQLTRDAHLVEFRLTIAMPHPPVPGMQIIAPGERGEDIRIIPFRLEDGMEGGSRPRMLSFLYDASLNRYSITVRQELFMDGRLRYLQDVVAARKACGWQVTEH